MAENDIYNSKTKYIRFMENMIEGKTLLKKPSERKKLTSRNISKYYCKNKVNLQYFKKLHSKFSSRDLSYIRRIKLFLCLKMAVYVTDKDLKDLDRDDIDNIMGYVHTVFKSPKSKRDFIVDIKTIWKHLFPEKDEKGRIDDDVMPYVVRHLKKKSIDISTERRKDDKLTVEEFEKLVQAFSQDIRLQAYLTLAFESLGRPQELLYTRIKDVELHDNYAKIWISEHGKEGTGFLEVIDSYPYVVNWYNQHPLKNNPNAFFFINLGNLKRYGQLTPMNVNKHIKEKLKVIGINKPVTCYSLKRSGVTYRRLRGDSDVQIQHTARWKSTKQLNTYDFSQHDETFKIELAKRGIVKDKKYEHYQTTTKKCTFCDAINGIADSVCNGCKRPLDRKKIVAEMENKDNRINQLEKQIVDVASMVKQLRNQDEQKLEKASITKIA